ncbi:HGxxPAAW family protein [Streptomyces zhihengii]|uniref:HGxxPAAW family protein n=1 Tax=Streptomyces zhihengii TaxID=1818004 RepID=UPI001FD3C043|nr:HGxxPAAW family protein [Streptomyces zhihengii]
MGVHGDHDLGHTVAGWTGTGIAVAGCGLAGAGLAAASGALLAAGAAVTVLAAVVTWALHLAGWGKPSGPRPVAEHSWRVRDTSAAAGHPSCAGCRLAGRRPRAAVPHPAEEPLSARVATAADDASPARSALPAPVAGPPA